MTTIRLELIYGQEPFIPRMGFGLFFVWVDGPVKQSLKRLCTAFPLLVPLMALGKGNNLYVAKVALLQKKGEGRYMLSLSTLAL